MIYIGNTKYKMYVGSTPRKFQTEKEYFYVFHSATGIIERHKMQNHFNLYELVSDGYIYEGYSFDIGKNDLAAGDYGFAIKNGTFEKEYPNIEWVDDKLQDINFAPFDGTSLTGTGHTGTSALINPAKAKYITLEKADNMTPIPGVIYYLIEVDAGKYSRPHFVRFAASKDSEGKYNAYLVCGIIATVNYKSVDIYINSVDTDAKISSSLTYYYYLNNVKKSITFKASNLGYRGYLCVSSDLLYGAGYKESFEDNTNYIIRMVLVTMDGMEIIRQLLLHTGDRTDDTFKTGRGVEYLELTGTQWIDTGLTFNGVDDFEFVFDVAPTRFYNYNPIHCINAGTANESWIDSSGGYAYRLAGVRSNNFALTLNQRVKIRNVYKNGKYDIYIDDTLKQSITCDPVSLTDTLWLFHRSAYAELKVYWVYIYKEGELVMGLQPVKLEKGYFFDYVNDQLISNSGTGDLILPTETNETNED